jgi:hypothetical protein
MRSGCYTVRMAEDLRNLERYCSFSTSASFPKLDSGNGASDVKSINHLISTKLT